MTERKEQLSCIMFFQKQLLNLCVKSNCLIFLFSIIMNRDTLGLRKHGLDSLAPNHMETRDIRRGNDSALKYNCSYFVMRFLPVLLVQRFVWAAPVFSGYWLHLQSSPVQEVAERMRGNASSRLPPRPGKKDSERVKKNPQKTSETDWSWICFSFAHPV